MNHIKIAFLISIFLQIVLTHLIYANEQLEEKNPKTELCIRICAQCFNTDQIADEYHVNIIISFFFSFPFLNLYLI
jgi:hypothetical protein